jgi:hypothetical protein
MTSATRTVLRVIAAAFFLFFLGFAGISAPLFRGQYKILRDWPTASGTVVSSDVISFPTTGGGELYDIEVRFIYVVNGRGVESAIRSNHESTSRARKEKQAAQFVRGERYPIRYNPAEPRDIRAQAGWNVHFFAVPIFVIGVGAIFGAIGAILLLAARGRQGARLTP